MNKIMNNLQTQKHCLCFSKWVIVRSRAAVYFHCIQLLTPNHALTCCWKYDLLACLTGGLRLFVAWRRHWVEPNWKNVSRLGLWWQDNSCLIQGNELNETLALCFSALTVNWLGIYLPWQVGKLNSFTIGDFVILYFRYRSDGEPASYHLHFRDFALGITSRSQGRKKEKSKISTVSNTISLPVEKTDQSFWVGGKTAKHLCMQIRQYKKSLPWNRNVILSQQAFLGRVRKYYHSWNASFGEGKTTSLF